MNSSGSEGSQSIANFISYDTYIKDSVSALEQENNILGLRCSTSKNKISYQGSEFDQISRTIKYQVSAISEAKKSYLGVFKNEPSLDGYFFPEHVEFNQFLLMNFIPVVSSHNDIDFSSADFSKKLFEGDLDDSILNYETKYASEEKQGLISKIKTAVDNYNTKQELFKKVIPILNSGKSVCMLTYIKAMRTYYHAIATVFWKSEDKYYCGLYDPLYYEREGDNNYVMMVNIAYVVLKFLANANGINLKIINLSAAYCVNNPAKGKHCVQYMVDSELCTMYSLYFIFRYASRGFPKNLGDIELAVKDTFITDPATIKRNPCRGTNVFRLVSMSFILTVLTIHTNDKTVLELVKTIYDRVASDEFKYNTYNYAVNESLRGAKVSKKGYDLLEPSIKKLLIDKLAAAGGKRRTLRRNRRDSRSSRRQKR